MSEWRDISTAPHGRVLLLYGTLCGHALTPGHPSFPIRVIGYWDDIDNAWALSDTTYLGPFIEPTHWADCPEPPESK